MSDDSPRWGALHRAMRPEQPTGPIEPALLAAVDRAFDAAHAAWPDVDVPDAPFAAALGRAARDTDDPVAAIAALCAEDLYLATGCALGLRSALHGFERELGGRLDARVQRLADAADTPDLQQAVRLKLLVGGDRPPRIVDYHGYGRLEPWLRVVVARMSVDAQRRRAPRPVAASEALLPAVQDDPELQYLKTHYATAMREAVAEAVSTLDARDRLVLRYQLVDKLGNEQIGVIYNVHAATVRRWVAKARERLLAGTRDAIADRLSVGEDEFTSIVRLVRSQLDVSIARLLQTQDE